MIFISTDILSPYKRDIISQDSYKTLIDFLQDKYPNGFKRPTDVSVNGIEIAIDDYDIELNEKDIVVLLDRAALPVGLIGGWFITALANLAISVTLSYVANKLFAPDAPGEQASPSPVYNLNNAQNVSRYGSPIPIIYGKVRMFPSMIVQPYYKFEDDVEYLHHVLCVGQGTNTADCVLIGDDDVTNAGGLDWKLLYQDSFYNIQLNGYGVHITKTLTTPSLMEIEVGDGESEKYTIDKDAEFLEFDYMYPNGLIYYESDGETTSAKTSFIMKLYTLLDGVYTEVDSKTFYMYKSTVDAIQITYRLDISSYSEDVYVSFEKTLNKASSFYITNTIIKRVKEIYPNEDFTNLYGDMTLLVCKIKATNAVSTAGQLKVNGYFTRRDVDNTIADVLTDIYTNTNYGGGLSIDDLDFPITTETVNCAYDSSMTIFDAMRKPAIAQGYSLYLAGMDVILKKDGVNTITSGMYNEMNISRNSLKVQYLFKEEFPSYDGYECFYMDGCDWVAKSEKFPATSTRPQRVDLFGVVDYSNACGTCTTEAPIGNCGSMPFYYDTRNPIGVIDMYCNAPAPCLAPLGVLTTKEIFESAIINNNLCLQGIEHLKDGGVSGSTSVGSDLNNPPSDAEVIAAIDILVSQYLCQILYYVEAGDISATRAITTNIAYPGDSFIGNGGTYTCGVEYVIPDIYWNGTNWRADFRTIAFFERYVIPA